MNFSDNEEANTFNNETLGMTNTGRYEKVSNHHEELNFTT